MSGDIVRLHTVADASEILFGRRVESRTVLRWVKEGRYGVKLKTIRGVRGQHCVTLDQLRDWFTESSNAEASCGGDNG